jgi:site-specific recombinase XerD
MVGVGTGPPNVLLAPRLDLLREILGRLLDRPANVSFEGLLGPGQHLSSLESDSFLFPSRVRSSPHLSTRQYARIVDSWVERIGLDSAAYGTHSIRRTKPSLIYRRTKNLRAVQLLLGHTKLESTVRYLGIEVEDALELAEQTEA